jgi:phosphoribosylglycinamide formyltransferase-1
MLTNQRPLRVAVLCSRRAPGLLHLLDADPRHGTSFEIACVITSEVGFPEAGAIRARRPAMITHSIAEFYAARSSSVYRDFATRRSYDRATSALLDTYAPDLVLLDGYLYLLTSPMLDAYRNRILNLHFSDLTIRSPDQRPAYAGIRAVRDAIADGQFETSATVHVVNEEPDGGAPVVRSWPYPVSPLVSKARSWDAGDMLKAYAYAHQEWMIRGVSGPLLSSALHLVSTGQVDLDDIAARDPATVMPWLVDERGRETPPEATRIHELLRGYHRASAHEMHECANAGTQCT